VFASSVSPKQEPSTRISKINESSVAKSGSVLQRLVTLTKPEWPPWLSVLCPFDLLFQREWK